MLSLCLRTLTLHRASVQGQTVPREVVHRRVGLTDAGQSQRAAGVHHAGGTSQDGRVLRGIWTKRERVTRGQETRRAAEDTQRTYRAQLG